MTDIKVGVARGCQAGVCFMAAKLLNGLLVWRIVLVSAFFLGGTFVMFSWAIARGYPLELARTLAVNTLVVMGTPVAWISVAARVRQSTEHDQ